MREPEKSELTKITWTAPEFVHYPKSPLWFGLAILAGLALTIYFFFQKDFLTAVLFLLLLIVIVVFAKMPPRTIKIELDGLGIKLNQRRLPYQQIKSFWIVYEPPAVKTLNLETTARLNRFLTLQLAEENPVKIREYLAKHLSEDLDKGEQFSDKLSRTLKF